MPGPIPSPRQRWRGCLLGAACGDAVGTTLEFSPRGSTAPLDDMVGGGPFRLKPGEWTDDTAMALCLAESLVERRGFDPRDQMERYLRWWRRGDGSCTGECFDVGNTIRSALSRFERGGDPFSGSADPRSAGNGSIMRLAPVPMFFAPDADAVVHHAGESSRTTHGCDEAVDACRLLGLLLLRALEGAGRAAILEAGREAPRWGGHGGRPLAPKIAALARGSWREKRESEIRGSGYVVDCLEAALWCFATTESYRDAVLRAANLGDDADTTAAVCGQLAGACYGEAGIPGAWRARVAWGDRIAELADALRRASPDPRRSGVGRRRRSGPARGNP
jgi:ADP-ribosyl-[dinitrogen reductase] hydrolase